MTPLAPRLFVFALALGGLRNPYLFAIAGTAAWFAVRRERPALGPAAAWLPWLGWAAMSTALSIQPLAGLPVLARWSVALACASLAASWNEREREAWLRSLLIVSVGVAVAALFTGTGRGFRSGMTGVLPPYYNYTAFVLAASASAACAWVLHPRGLKGREAGFAAAAGALAVLCLFLARSRGAWLGLAAAAAVWSTRRWGARALAGFLIAGALAGAALFAGLMPREIENTLFKKYRAHAEVRPRLWQAATWIASDSPFLGVGPGNFAVGFRRRPVSLEDGSARWAMTATHAHSEPLQAAAETGWAGMALWLIGLAAALRTLFRRAQNDAVREAAAAAAAAMTAQLAVDNMLQIPALAALWLSALAIAAPRPEARRWPAAAAIAGAALALVSWIPSAVASWGPARAAARVFPAEPGPREALAYQAMAARQGDDALAHWTEAERLEPFNAVYPWRQAQLFAAAGRWDRVEPRAARALLLEPGFMSARLLRAEALAHLGRRDQARAELAEIRRLKAERGDIVRASGYERTVWFYDAREYSRVAALAGG